MTAPKNKATKGQPTRTLPAPAHPRKCTAQEMERRVEFTADLLAKLFHKTEIHRLIRRKYGIGWDTVDRLYVPRARKLLLDRANKSKDDARSESIKFWEDSVGHAKTAKERHTARAALDRIYGVEAPRKTEITGAHGEAIKLESKTEHKIDYDELAKVASAVFGISEEDSGSQPVHPETTDSEASASVVSAVP